MIAKAVLIFSLQYCKEKSIVFYEWDETNERGASQLRSELPTYEGGPASSNVHCFGARGSDWCREEHDLFLRQQGSKRRRDVPCFRRRPDSPRPSPEAFYLERGWKKVSGGAEL